MVWVVSLAPSNSSYCCQKSKERHTSYKKNDSGIIAVVTTFIAIEAAVDTFSYGFSGSNKKTTTLYRQKITVPTGGLEKPPLMELPILVVDKCRPS